MPFDTWDVACIFALACFGFELGRIARTHQTASAVRARVLASVTGIALAIAVLLDNRFEIVSAWLSFLGLPLAVAALVYVVAERGGWGESAL